MSDTLSAVPEPDEAKDRRQAASPKEYPGPIVFTVRLRARPDKIEAAERALEKIAGPIRANPDCLEFRVFQDRENPHLFTLLEHWVSVQAVTTHGQRDYMAEYMATKHLIFEDMSGEPVQEIHPLNAAPRAERQPGHGQRR
ncbi:antibiotic biosynthesis monooxygenase [Nonomuraea sp. SMC257]|uniref:Antibiotic biosynthesis monooxygenase n=1 Tax=Nonomuraea montanisoli TaxID=2741721 RepID=A0A7Y6M6I5_9ACTN|nr:putative quinol monooxygenase [Nonomuraea montanisoli]NUW35641.1 antibiotic biosynthesis monooxygenase [Nonomuraea montanisoli]